MTLFEGPAPRIYALPPGTNYAEALTEGLCRRLSGGPPEAMAGLEIYLNTRRGQRAVEEALVAAATETGGGLLPRLSLLSELGEDPLARPDLPPAIDRLRRRLRLTRLVEHFLQTAPGRAPLAAAPDLAETLARLIDELDEEGVPPASLDGLVEGEIARHWQEALAFADIVRVNWPAIRAEEEGAALDPNARQRAVIEGLVRHWQTAPPEHPVLVAGTTGSRAPTAELMAAIARLPQGAVILPGFDPAMAPEVLEAAGPEHPYGPFRRFFDLVQAVPSDVRPWIEVEETPRLRLLSQALRPAPVTDAWVEAAPALSAEAEAATSDLSLVEAESSRHEAAAIALAIREALEEPATRIALVTRDATLARRVTAELDRFGIVPDSSLGQPLSEAPAGVFLRLIAEAAAGPDPLRLAALLQHPMTRAGLERSAHLRIARRYDRDVLRRVPDLGLPAGRIPPWPERRAGDHTPEPPEGFEAWAGRIEAALVPLAGALSGGAPLGRLAAIHRDAALALSTGPGAPGGEIASGKDGEKALALLARLERAADAFGDSPAPGYGALLTTLLSEESIDPDPVRPHPRVVIWGTIEARVQSADLMILGGLNEGSWPPAPAADPWLSRPMREALGLSLPERETGLSAHDFLQAAARPRAILSRATRVDGTPTVAARWLERLENLLRGTDPDALCRMRKRGEALLALVPAIHRPAAPLPPAPRPAARPPVAARPRRLSVTQVEMLIRDAYAVYALKVLGLKPLDPLGRAPNFMDRGSVIHRILERFVEETPDITGGIAREHERLLATAQSVLTAEVPWPDTRRIWYGRIARAARWFVEQEDARRAAGRWIGLEKAGKLDLSLPAGPFTLKARADRIDRLKDGTAAIYDYKAGQVPGKREIGKFAQQLHLQALILADGGFEGLPALATSRGAYIGLTGSGPGGTEREVDDELTTGAAERREHLTGLLAAYDREETPYISRGRMKQERDDGDYDHLARRAEWEGEDRG